MNGGNGHDLIKSASTLSMIAKQVEGAVSREYIAAKVDRFYNKCKGRYKSAISNLFIANVEKTRCLSNMFDENSITWQRAKHLETKVRQNCSVIIPVTWEKEKSQSCENLDTNNYTYVIDMYGLKNNMNFPNPESAPIAEPNACANPG